MPGNSVLPPFADLRSVAAEIGKKPEFKRLSSVIEKAARTQSCVTDLRKASDCLEALAELLPSPRRRGTRTRSAIESSLLLSAVVLYERATSAAGKRGERGSITLRDSLTPDQLEDHLAIVDVRQRAIAHVYLNEVVSGEVWHHDLLFAVGLEPGWQIASATRSVQFDQLTYERLKRQVPVAKTLLVERFIALTQKVVELLNAHPLEEELLERHVLDPVTAFGSIEAALAILAGREEGSATFLSK